MLKLVLNFKLKYLLKEYTKPTHYSPRLNEIELDSSIDLPLPDWKNSTNKSNANLFALVKGISSWSEDEVRGKFCIQSSTIIRYSQHKKTIF